MFTTGSKLFIGATTLAVVGALIFGITQSDSKLGTIGLVSAAIALVFLMGINFWVRDSNVSPTDTAALTTAPASHEAPPRSMWPMVAALGVALIPVGLVVGRAITWMAVIVILVATVEWMVQSWSERASADSAYNASIRKRIMHPLELPVLGALGLGLIIFSFSRIMLRLPAAAGAIAFGAVASIVLLFGSLLAAKRTVGRSVVGTLCTIGAVGIIGFGVTSAIAGGREIVKHEIPSFAEGTCGTEHGEADHNASRAIALKSNLAATIVLQNGTLHADVIGVIGAKTTITLGRSTNSYIRFVNLDDDKHRLVADLGVDEVNINGTATKVPQQSCTQAVGKDGAQFLVLRPTRPSFSSTTPFTLSVPGVDSTITIEVP
ncbi:unannotated protein [freshwater metagenome]|uniref:Unannotated protein n=1 Tax=freshwater metagenome TaxID=449393 RepID=A0A6J7DMP7_9ZZZZ|nr:hypothetical protein [Actinomycetota bacterium]